MSSLIMIPILISFLILVKFLLKYPSLYTIQLILSGLCIILWTTLVLPVYLINGIDDQISIIIEHLGTIFGALGAIFLMFVISNTLTPKIKSIARISVIGFSTLIGAKLLQFSLKPTETIYGLKIDSGSLVRVNSPIIQILIYLSFFGFIVSYYYYNQYQKTLPSGFISERIKYYGNLSLFFVAFGMIVNIIGFSIEDVIISGYILILSRILITTGYLAGIYIISNNPILNYSEKGNPMQFKGLVGWIVSGNRNHGPETITYSKDFFYNNENILQSLSVRLITSIGIGKATFSEELVLLPYNSHDKSKFTIIGYSFKIKDPELTDNRKEGQCDTVFSIVIPNILLRFINNFQINNLKEPIEKVINQNNNLLNQFIRNTSFDNLTFEIIRNLSTKNLF